MVGEFLVEGLSDVPAGNQIVVRLDLDLSGILEVTATERATGVAKKVTIDNAMERFRTRQRSDAIERLEQIFETVDDPGWEEDDVLEPAVLSMDGLRSKPAVPTADHRETLTPALMTLAETANQLIARAQRVLLDANPADAAELESLTTNLNKAIDRRSESEIQMISREIEDIVFYLEDR